MSADQGFWYAGSGLLPEPHEPWVALGSDHGKGGPDRRVGGCYPRGGTPRARRRVLHHQPPHPPVLLPPPPEWTLIEVVDSCLYQIALALTCDSCHRPLVTDLILGTVPEGGKGCGGVFRPLHFSMRRMSAQRSIVLLSLVA